MQMRALREMGVCVSEEGARARLMSVGIGGEGARLLGVVVVVAVAVGLALLRISSLGLRPLPLMPGRLSRSRHLGIPRRRWCRRLRRMARRRSRLRFLIEACEACVALPSTAVFFSLLFHSVRLFVSGHCVLYSLHGLPVKRGRDRDLFGGAVHSIACEGRSVRSVGWVSCLFCPTCT